MCSNARCNHYKREDRDICEKCSKLLSNDSSLIIFCKYCGKIIEIGKRLYRKGMLEDAYNDSNEECQECSIERKERIKADIARRK